MAKIYYQILSVSPGDRCPSRASRDTVEPAASRALSAVLLPAQPVNATQALNLSAGVSNCKVSRGRFLCRSKPSMKSSIHQSTLHLSFKIKRCADRLRPPPNSDQRADIMSQTCQEETHALRLL